MTGPTSRPDAVLATVHAIAERLRTPGDVGSRTRQAHDRAPAGITLSPWQPAQLLVGHTGIALLYSRLAHDDNSWAAVAHAHLSAALAGVTPGTVGDLLLAAHLHARAHGGYARLLERAAPAHESAARGSLDGLTVRLRTKGPGLAYAEYDLVSGLTGSGRRLMAGADLGDERCAATLHELLGLLTRMAEPVRVHGAEVPGWWTAPHLPLVPEADRASYPLGDFNLGVAHGICGPLSLLATAHRAGHRVPHMTGAMRVMADWLLAKRLRDEWGVYWPGRVGFEEETGRAGGRSTTARNRSGWCYGAAGVARTLYLAGRELDAPELIEAAVDAMRAVLRRPYSRAAIPDATFCHGRAGILQAAVRTAADTGDPQLWAGADRLAHELARDFDPASDFGYRFPLHLAPGAPGVDEPGLVQGAAGIALTLLSYADARGGRPLGADAWDTVLLMA
ncbi:lanthionine synthetase C family protein [Streptomyces roseoverticillatus]|uniref:lanthionine synthetase C family protein n=1 Tax=Streptomyces roseoverticillatus TaxID=66429 RepID=UPI001F48044A|nr:lanthionine synthetase C family protein [Streptomyces roseoverticillatus]MCF3106550.1 lanthionine synthetase C family protein [Streptomyces roseoverticillatus]